MLGREHKQDLTNKTYRITPASRQSTFKSTDSQPVCKASSCDSGPARLHADESQRSSCSYSSAVACDMCE